MNLLFHLVGFLHREDLVELAPDDQNLLPQVEIDSFYDDDDALSYCLVRSGRT